MFNQDQRNVDCNKCLHINVTENKQIGNEPHICKLYNKRVFHKVSDGCRTLTTLTPCIECERNNYMFARLTK